MQPDRLQISNKKLYAKVAESHLKSELTGGMPIVMSGVPNYACDVSDDHYYAKAQKRWRAISANYRNYQITGITLQNIRVFCSDGD